MLQGILIKKVINLIAKQFKLDKILKYVEEPNDLDKQVKTMQKNISKYGQYIERMEKDIASIKAITKKLKIFK